MTELAEAVRLDAAGFMAGVSEDFAAFSGRVSRMREADRRFGEAMEREGRQCVFDGLELNGSDRIGSEVVEEAAGITSQLYGFEARHVPGFYLTSGVGLLWGGCMIGDPEQDFSVFLLRGAFRSKRRWLFYDRSELLAHELCHSMRQVLAEPTLEEYFAYQTSPSRLRRIFGNCFIYDRDAVLFLLPTLLLLVMEILAVWFERLPVWPFWFLAFAYPVYLLWRNYRSQRCVVRAARALGRCGVTQIPAILFRCTREELLELGRLRDPGELERFVTARSAGSLRWQVIAYRFLGSRPEAGTAGEAPECVAQTL